MKSMFSQFFASLISGIVFLGVLGGGFGVFEVAADECCTEAGYADECWWESAEDDGVTCTTNSDCDLTCDKTVTDPSNSNVGLCSCASDADCVSGVCNVDNRCGPSWCNGYLICSCFGGCINAELGTYVNPEAMCTDTTSGYPGTCCEGTFPDGVGGVGYCSDDPTCNGGCTSDSDCNDGNPCTQDECINNGCVNTNLDGNINDLDGFGNPIGAACPFDTSIYDVECALPACDNGACSVDTDFNDGGDCDEDTNVCTAGFCALGACDESNPLVDPELSANPECCNPAVPGSEYDFFGGPTECVYYYCASSIFHDTQAPVGTLSGTACLLAPPQDCADGICDATDNCVPDPWPSGAACTSPGPFNNCTDWACDGAGVCAPIYEPAGTFCTHEPDPPGLPMPLDPCAYAYCDAVGNCVDAPPLEGEDCSALIGAGPCEFWQCEYSNPTYPLTLFCTFDSMATPDADLEICHDPMTAAQDLGVIGYTEQTILDSNECAEDDYDAITTSGFSACAGYLAGPNNADYVYNFDVNVNPALYSLEHVAANLNRDGSTGWDPYLHSREDCEDDTSSTGDQKTCNSNQFWTGTHYPDYGGQYSGAPPEVWSASLTVGPWPLRDLTDYNDPFGADDGIVTESDWSAQLIVDTWNYSNPMPGGDFELNVIKETHYNNDCKDSASYIAGPVIDNFTSWKERWRGTTNHANYINREGTGNDTNCGTATHDANNPASAYYRVDLDNTTQSDWNEGPLQWESVDWDSLYKVSIDPALDPSHLNAALTLWHGSAGPGPCNISSAASHSCGGSSGGLQDLIVMSGTWNARKWLEVSNYVTNANGDYELQVIKVPREFLGFKEAFSGDNSGCETGGGSNPGQSTWSAGGRQLDFVPTNDKLAGYLVKVDTSPSTTGAGWLVDPLNQLCQGSMCTSGTAAGQVRTLPFDFPFSGHFFDRIRIDASGRIDIGSGDSSDPYYLSTTGGFIWDDIGNSLNSNSDSENMRASRYNPMLAPMWGKIIPCMCSSVNTTGGWGSTYTSWNEGACYNDGSSSDGRIYVQNAQWDGSTVTVVTWDGFDGHQEPVQPVCTNWSWGSCTDWACDYHYSSASDRAHFLQFQVIIRQDGRFTFFYKSTNGVTQPILSYNGWMVGVSGTWHSGQTCDNGSGTSPNPAYSPDNWCDVVLGEPSGTMGLSCDNDPGYAPNGDEVFTPGYWCSNNVQDLHSGLSGSWQTGE